MKIFKKKRLIIFILPFLLLLFSFIAIFTFQTIHYRGIIKQLSDDYINKEAQLNIDNEALQQNASEVLEQNINNEALKQNDNNEVQQNDNNETLKQNDNNEVQQNDNNETLKQNDNNEVHQNDNKEKQNDNNEVQQNDNNEKQNDNKEEQQKCDNTVQQNEEKKNIKSIDYFIELRNDIEMHSALWDSVFERDDILKYKKALINGSSFLLQKNFRKKISGNKKTLAALHQKLYPWMYSQRYKSLKEMIESFNGKGIVICTGKKHFRYARSTIDALRNVLNCTLPIEVFYSNNNDLPLENRTILSEYENVYLSDISTYFNNTIVDIEGWAIKPFAILASRFEEVLLMDADVVYLHNPEDLFEEEGYLKVGSLFFKDRSLYPGPNKQVQWMKSWMSDPLLETSELRFYNKQTVHEMESSTVVIHKIKVFNGLLAACKLNEKRMRSDVVYKVVHGDKETFWIGFDMARMHYNLNPSPVAFIGKCYENRVCGHIGHTIHNKLYFWNGHLVKNKSNVDKLELVDFNGYYFEDKNIKWSPNLECLIFNRTLKAPTPLSTEESHIFRVLIDREKTLHYIIPKKEEKKTEENKEEENKEENKEEKKRGRK